MFPLRFLFEFNTPFYVGDTKFIKAEKSRRRYNNNNMKKKQKEKKLIMKLRKHKNH